MAGQRTYKPRHRRVETGHREINIERDKRQKLYNNHSTGWKAYSKRFLKVNPECYACGERAMVVDHLVPHLGDETIFMNTTNHVPLCVKCHNTVTALFDRKYVKGSSVDEKLKWLNSKRIPTDEWTPKRVKVIPYRERQ